MVKKLKKRPAPLKKALPLLPEEERELFPKGKPEHPDKLIRDAGEFSLFMNRNMFTKRAFYLIRNYWRLGKKPLAIILSSLYIFPVIISVFLGFIAGYYEETNTALASIVFIPVIIVLVVWMLVYYLAPTVMVWHQRPLYEEFKQDYNAVRHEFLSTPIKKKR